MLHLLLLTVSLTLGQSPDSPPQPFQAARFREHVAYLASDELQGRRPGTEGSKKAADYIAGHFKKSALSPLGENGGFAQPFTIYNQAGTNLLAVLPGQGKLADEAILVCAHYDHLGSKPVPAGQDGIYNGANDNAAGVAAILLIAEAVAAKPGDPAAPRRSVVFIAFDCEERGLLGAAYYLQHPKWPLKKTYAVMDFDSMARPTANRVYAADVSSSAVLQKRIEALAKPCGLRVETRLTGAGHRSDHGVFLNANIPAFLFFTGLNSDYHQVTDELKTIDCEGAARIAWLGYRMLAETATDPTVLTFQRPAQRFDIQFALRLFGRLGTFPKLGTQSGRYPVIGFVAPNGPAAKFGIKPEDQITAINGQTFERLEDSVLVFSQVQLSTGLRLSILRDGKEVDVLIPGKWFADLSGPRGRPLGDDKFEVTFNYRPRGQAKALYLAGTFNDWKPTALKMDGPDAKGAFTTKLVLKKGIYEYKFVLDGKNWEADSENIYLSEAYQNNLLFVGVEP